MTATSSRKCEGTPDPAERGKVIGGCGRFLIMRRFADGSDNTILVCPNCDSTRSWPSL